MKKEKPLSERRIEVGEYHNGMLVYSEKYVIEAVEKLKEEIPNEVIDPETNTELYVWEEIDKIMGEFELKKK